MKIVRVESWKETLPLTRPYTIATMTVESVDLFFVQIETSRGIVGLGSASPAESLTGESSKDCELAFEAIPPMLMGHDLRALGTFIRAIQQRMIDTPAACAAIDMAFYDVFARTLRIPLVDFLGRCHEALPTSITIGIKSTEEALDEADEYIGRGFRHLKVKLGHDVEADLERLHRLCEHVGPDVLIRVDANQGFTVAETRHFFEETAGLDLEFIEQPLPTDLDMRTLPEEITPHLAADESLHTEADAFMLASAPSACGIFNIKLMKSGGITAARSIAGIAQAAGLGVMWGCMDESRVSIAAALHTAYASPATRYLDLDGSFDLAQDFATGGFVLENGLLHLTDEPGLGVKAR